MSISSSYLPTFYQLSGCVDLYVVLVTKVTVPPFVVQRASVSFCRSRARFPCQPSGSFPSLSCLFSSLVFCWRGTSTKLASTIFPSLTAKPSTLRRLEKWSNKARTPASPKRCLNSQIVFLSGTLSATLSPGKALKTKPIQYLKWTLRYCRHCVPRNGVLFTKVVVLL